MELNQKIGPVPKNAAAITDALTLTPEHATKAGPDISSKGIRRLYSESYWLARLPSVASESRTTWAPQIAKEDLPGVLHAGGYFDIFLFFWLRKLDDQKAFFRQVNDDQGSVTLVLQRADRSTSFTVSPALAKRIVELGIRLEID